MKTKFKLLLLAGCLSLILCACGSGPEGTYSDGRESYTFYSDGTLLNAVDGGLSFKGTYEKNDKGSYDLFLDAGLFSTSGTFTVDGDVLTVTINGTDYQYTKE